MVRESDGGEGGQRSRSKGADGSFPDVTIRAAGPRRDRPTLSLGVKQSQVPVDGATRTLSTPDGAQAGFIPDGRALIAPERGGDKLSAFAAGMDAMLGEARTILRAPSLSGNTTSVSTCATRRSSVPNTWIGSTDIRRS